MFAATGMKALGILLVVLACVGIYYRYEHLVSELQASKDAEASLRAGFVQQLRANDVLQGRITALDSIFAIQAGRQKDLLAAITGIRSDLSVLKTKDPAVRAWAETVLPDAIYQRLREPEPAPRPGGDKGAAGAKGAADTVSGPVDTGKFE